MEEKISSGSEVIDQLLGGGFEKSCITTVYGPGGSGKTNICMIGSISELKKGHKVIYVDTDGSFSSSRFCQLTTDEDLLSNMIFFRPVNFSQQKKSFDNIKKIINETNEKISLIIVDSIAMLYRLELGKGQDVYNTNKDLGIQLAYLIEVARTKNIPVLLTNQVYADMNDRETVRMVGGDLLKYSSKCLIELKKTDNNERAAILRKHRSLPEKKQVRFEIENCGFKESKGEKNGR